jgi:hypothetical protein
MSTDMVRKDRARPRYSRFETLGASASSWCDEDTEFVDFGAEKALEQGGR